MNPAASSSPSSTPALRLRDGSCRASRIWPAPAWPIASSHAGRPIAGIDRYFLQIRKDDQDAFSSYLQGQESGFEWAATGPGVYEVVLTPNDAAGLTGLVATCSAVVFPQRAFLRADCNADGDVDISDPISLLGYLFLGASAVGCADACDANDDNALDISDGIQP